MPRYCAVKACRNRGGSTSSQDNKRISFYPFPLQDKPRLQKWVDNMKREEWTPSRHQCLCSEHFTEDCFDIRWGIRYLKHSAIPTVFPSNEDDDGKKGNTIKMSPTVKPSGVDTHIDSKGFDSPLSKRPLILRRACTKFRSSTTNNIVASHTQMTFDVPLVSDTGISCHPNLSEMHATACYMSSDTAISTSSCNALSQCGEAHSAEPDDSTVTLLCCESMGPFADGEANMDSAALQAALDQTLSFVPVGVVKDTPIGCSLEEWGPTEGGHISIHEHSYCRADTDKDQLWSKILNLHAKILELDQREENTVAKIHALETEIALLKRDGAVFKDKQNVLDCISSMLL